MRVHFYPHKGPKTTAHIVGEKSGLLKLSKALEQAARGAVGTETVELYSGDGHSYEVVITKDVSEQEWQTLDLPSAKNANPEILESIKSYKELKKEMQKRLETTDCV